MVRQTDTAPPQTVLFLHIPKTAGTTLAEIAYRQYHQTQIYNDILSEEQAVQRFANLPANSLENIRLLWGHFSFGLHQYLPGSATYFTFLRHPVERVISHYYYLYNNPEMFWMPDQIREEKMTLHEVLEQELIVDIKNMYTRLLAGLPYLFPVDEYTEDHLQTAKENLRDSFSVVGLVERFDESLLLLQKAYGWEHIFYMRENVNAERPKQESIAPETIALIERQNELDMRLYAFGQALFAEQVAQHGLAFSLKVRWFQLQNRLWAWRQGRRKRP